MTDEVRPADDALPLPALCPFLLAADGAWRSSSAAREHRCTAVTPPAPLAAEKQRRLCLTEEHLGCATFMAAREARAATHRTVADRRPVARTTPVLLDHGRLAVAMPTLGSAPSISQGALIGVLGVAFGAVLIAKIATGGPAGPAGAVASPSPTRSPATTAGALASATPRVTATPVPTGTTSPTATAKPSPSPSPTLVPTGGKPTPTPTTPTTPTTPAAHGTYKVKSGDTMYSIASKFGTTVKALAKLNGISDPTKIHVGQVLKLP